MVVTRWIVSFDEEVVAKPISVTEMNFGEIAAALKEQTGAGFVGLARLSMSVCRLSWVRNMTSGSDAATGVAVHEILGAAGGSDGDADTGDGDASGLGDGLGEAIAGGGLTSEGDGVDATRPVARGVPQAQAIVTSAIAVPIRTLSTYQSTAIAGLWFRAPSPRLGRVRKRLGARASSWRRRRR